MPERVVREGELEPRGTVVGEVVFDEGDERAPRAVVEQHVVVEDEDGLGSRSLRKYSTRRVTAPPASVKPVRAITSGRPDGTGGAAGARSYSGAEEGMTPLLRAHALGRPRCVPLPANTHEPRMDAMPFPSVAFTDAPVRESDADAILLIVPPSTEGASDPAGWEGLGAALAAVGFTGAAGSFQRVHVPGVDTPVAVAGAGAGADEAAVRDAAGTGLRQLTGFAHVAVQSLVAAPWRPIAEGAALGGYRFADYKKKSPKARAERVTVSAAEAPSDADVAAVAAISGPPSLVKDLVTTPAEWLGPADFADAAVAAVADLPSRWRCSTRRPCARAATAESSASARDPTARPVWCAWSTRPRTRSAMSPSSGKGITFDTAGCR